MKELQLQGGIPERSRRDVSPRIPGRAHPYLVALVRYLERNLIGIDHFYQGGFFIGEYTREPRYTQDVDMSILDLSAYERVKEVLSSYGEELISVGTISRYLVKDSASERHSGGAKYYAPDGSILFSIDIGFHEKQLDTVAIDIDDIGNVTITTVEQMLCDKLSALFSDRRQRRIKDLYDAWHLITTCEIDREHLILCLDRRGLFPLKSEDSPFNLAVVDRVEDAYSRLDVVDVCTNRARMLPDFSEIDKVLTDFLSGLTDSEV